MSHNRWRIRKRPRISVEVEYVGKRARKGPSVRAVVEVAEETQNPLVAAKALRETLQIIDDQIADLVDQARQAGRTWEEVGAALGMSRQAAWERFSV